FDLEGYRAGIAPQVEFVDRRMVGFPSGHGVQELLRAISTVLEAADDVATRIDGILDARPDAFLVRWTTSGTDRTSHGSFEWQFLRLCTFRAPRRLTPGQQIESDPEAEALAGLDEVTSHPPHTRAPSLAANARPAQAAPPA